MTNAGDTDYADILSGYVIWTEGGYLFSTPGLTGEDGPADPALADWVATYNADWMIGLHSFDFNAYAYKARDFYLKNTLKPGETKTLAGTVQVGPSGDISPLVQAEMARRNLAAGTIKGRVATVEGDEVTQPAVVFVKDGQPYTWRLGTDGRYEIRLPEGEYQAYATAAGFAPSETASLTVKAGESIERDFLDLKAPGTVVFNVSAAGTGAPLDARIKIAEGFSPLIKFLGQKTFFTEIEKPGLARFTIAPGKYVFQVEHGANFVSKSVDVPVELESQEEKSVDTQIGILARPGDCGWYGADLHHHSDVLDGYTPPEYVVRSQLAAGLDLLFLSDHDDATNHLEMYNLAAKRNVPFLPAIEVSPSWAHFNIYPVALGEQMQLDVGAATVDELFAESRRLGARIIAANHAYIPYGYFYSLDRDLVPGGFNPHYDLIEINGASSKGNREKCLAKAMGYWNQGLKYYLVAGTDVHDVWGDPTGNIRTYVHLAGGFSMDAYLDGLQAGRSFVSFGPLVYPAGGFDYGDELLVEAGETLDLDFLARAVNDLKKVVLYCNGEPVREVTAFDAPDKSRLHFSIAPDTNAWYSLMVEDGLERTALTNPIWVKVVEYTKTPEKVTPCRLPGLRPGSRHPSPPASAKK